MTADEIKAEIGKYKWYHRIELTSDIATPGIKEFVGICEFIRGMVRPIDYKGKAVLDIGTRDCLHALRAEQKGAGCVVAIDNDISAGARDFVLPFLESKIQLRHQSLYDLTEEAAFDVIQFFGVLYHLRYPFSALRRVVVACKVGGLILIEGGFLVEPIVEKMELLLCPATEGNPYDPSSCSFFNCAGIDATLQTMGCKRLAEPEYMESKGQIRRGFFCYQKMADVSYEYWEGLHTLHSRGAHDKDAWQPDAK